MKLTRLQRAIWICPLHFLENDAATVIERGTPEQKNIARAVLDVAEALIDVHGPLADQHRLFLNDPQVSQHYRA